MSKERRRQRRCGGGGVCGSDGRLEGSGGMVGGGPEERGRVGWRRWGGGGVWRGPLGPLNWHVQARGFGREAGAVIRHVTVQSYFLQPGTTLLSIFILKFFDHN